MAPAAVRALRVALGDNVATFGARFAVSGRTVEDWEQGRHTPRGLAARALATLAARVDLKREHAAALAARAARKGRR